MNTLKTIITAMFLSLVVLVSCNKSKPVKDVTLEAPQDTTTEANTTPLVPEVGLSDTVGLYKLANAEARAYVVDMFTILSDIETAMKDNAPARMPALMGKQRALQHQQTTIQSSLSEGDRALFNIYNNKIADKLDAIANKMERM